MKLTDLDPRWVMMGGRRVGFVFQSPDDPHWYLSCFAYPMPAWQQRMFFIAMFGPGYRVLACDPANAWTFSPKIAKADFDTLRITEAIDGTAAGLWRGFVFNGGITQ